MAQQDYTGLGKDSVEVCRCCGESKNIIKSMFTLLDYQGYCYSCFDAIPGCIPETQQVRYLNRMAERRVENEQTLQ